MHLFKKEETWYKKKITILGIKISFKKQRPAEMSLSKRIKALKLNFYNKVGYPLDIKNPETFNAKINWMKLFYRNNAMTRIVDKYEFKKYIAEQLGDGYTVPLFGVWDKVEDIDFSKLPDRFVLKSNAQSEGKFIKIVTDRNSIDIPKLKEELKNWLVPSNTLITSFCWAYNNVKPKIIAEEYIEQIDKQVYDYKFMCFNGEPRWVLACCDRGKNTVYENHDMDWNLIIPSPKSANKTTIEKPIHFDKMVDIAKKLSVPFPFVRVDFYEIKDQIYIGEMTFYPNAGYNTYYPEWDLKFGSYIKLPKVKIHQPFFEKEKFKYKRIIKIWGNKILSYHKFPSKKELIKKLDATEDAVKLLRTRANDNRSALNNVENRLNAEIKKTSNRFNDERLMNQKMFNYLYQDKLTDDFKKSLLEERFYREVGYFPDIENPQTFNEKINWLKLYYKNDILSRCVDKYEFKNYIKEQLGDGYTVPLLGVWDNANDIDLSKLPDRFVLKVNWSSYQNFIVKDKNKFNFDYAKSKINSWMLPWRNIYYASFYYGYKNVVPKVIAEEYIEQSDGKLNDYKFYCFNGNPQYLYIIDEGFSKARPLCWDVDSNHIYKIVNGQIDSIKQPQNMDKMLEIAAKLAKPFPFVRVDLYEIGTKVYVGEMTFYPGNGFNKFTPKELDAELGATLDLSSVNKDLI